MVCPFEHNALIPCLFLFFNSLNVLVKYSSCCNCSCIFFFYIIAFFSFESSTFLIFSSFLTSSTISSVFDSSSRSCTTLHHFPFYSIYPFCIVLCLFLIFIARELRDLFFIWCLFCNKVFTFLKLIFVEPFLTVHKSSILDILFYSSCISFRLRVYST